MHPAIEDALRGKRILWGAPTIEQSAIGWQEAKFAAANVAEFHISGHTAQFPTGGSIVFKTLDDPNNARGFTFDGAVLDEAPLLKPEAFYDVVRYTLSDTGGWLLAMGTPNGRNWYATEHRAAIDRPDSIAFQAPTLGVAVVDGRLVRKPHPLENPYFSFDEAVAIFNSVPWRTFQQEFLAQILEGEGAVFRNIAACLNAPTGATYQQHSGHNIVCGGDWGKYNDYTAASFLCVDCRCEVELYRATDKDLIDHLTYVEGRLDYWHATAFLPERNSMGEPLVELAVRHGTPIRTGPDGEPGFNTGPTTKAPLIESLVLAFERTEFQWLPDEVGKIELEAYERKVSPITFRPTYSAPEGLHDDTVIARCLANYLAQSGESAIETVENHEYTINGTNPF